MQTKFNRYLVLVVVTALLAMTAGIVTGASVTQSITYQGKLTDPGGTPLSGTYPVTFSLYDVPSGGTALVQNHQTITCTNGLFTTPVMFLPENFDGQALWLGVAVGSDPEMTPRQEIRPVPYALSLRPGATILNNDDSQPALTISNPVAGIGLYIKAFGDDTRGITIDSRGEGSDGIKILTQSERNDGIEIVTTSEVSEGIKIRTGEHASPGIRIETEDENSPAIIAKTEGIHSPGAKIFTYDDESNGVNITTYGEESVAVNAVTENDNTEGIRVETSGTGSHGVYSVTHGGNSAGLIAVTDGDNSGAIAATTSGNESYGLYAKTRRKDSDAIKAYTEGISSAGVNVSTMDNLSPGVIVHTYGRASDGIQVFTNDWYSNGVYVVTSEPESYGVNLYAEGEDSDAVHATASGTNSHAVYAYSQQDHAIYADTDTPGSFYGVYTPDKMSAHGYDTNSGDVAEFIPATEDVEPGTVLVIGPDGKLLTSSAAYDTRVAGIVSTQPGLALATKEGGNPGEEIVALAGRVPCKVDAGYGAIHPGDVLTTSATPGHAMKAVPVNAGGVEIYRPGTVLGKALGTLESGTGTIEVLVTLQ